MQKAREEREFLEACRAGDLETVRRLAKVMNPTRVKDVPWFEWSRLHYTVQ